MIVTSVFQPLLRECSDDEGKEYSSYALAYMSLDDEDAKKLESKVRRAGVVCALYKRTLDCQSRGVKLVGFRGPHCTARSISQNVFAIVVRSLSQKKRLSPLVGRSISKKRSSPFFRHR